MQGETGRGGKRERKETARGKKPMAARGASQGKKQTTTPKPSAPRGDLRKTPSASAHGVSQSGKKKSRCPFSGQCGGCQLIDVPYAAQLKAKQARVEECIGRFGPVEPILRMKNPDHYRNKVTSVFSYDKKRRPVCGVYRERSHDVVPVRGCLLEDKRADEVVQTIFSLLPSFKIRIYNEDTGTGLLRYVQIRTARATRQMMVTLVTADPVFPSKNNFVKALRARHPEITTIVLNINRRSDSMILGEREIPLYGPGYIEDELCGRRFRLSSRSFYQVNPIQTEKLYHLAVDAAGLSGRERALDAYCGIGTIGIIAADRCREVLSVELNPEAARDAARNARANGFQNVSVVQDDAGALMEKLAQRGECIDVLFLDPPRAGASEEFLRAACTLRPKRIVYVSCNPETLGRDLVKLTENGYRMKKATPVDMFPYTAGHVETVAMLTREAR